ncbi:MAG: family 1 glycosylhydrolase [Parachlamydiales bacterium]|nr:family 1 glycosylhydrolase [Parachlamydiales bacterium]
MANVVLQGMAQCLAPPPDLVRWNGGRPEKVELNGCEKVLHVAANIFRLLGYLAMLPFACVYSMGKYGVSLIMGNAEKPKIEGPVDPNALPDHFGFADSLFQTSGLGTRYSATPLEGRCDWDEFISQETIEGGERDYRQFFVDVLRNPQPFIDILKNMNVSAHRFSLEWSVIEPQRGQINEEAVGLYRNFIQQLKANGIEPYVTLHHFVCPKWFLDAGGFENLENVGIFKDHALRMMELFPEVTHWMPFNEINIDGFQKSVRGVYPPGKTGDIAGAGNMMRNMLLAHCQIYKDAKARRPDLQIGSTHQWLNFQPLEGNWLEQSICYFLSKITHYACYDFFKTGKFSMDVPGVANVQMEIPKEEFDANNQFSDFLGVQFYGYPQLKAGFNGWHPYPGYKINNVPYLGLTFGSTSPEGRPAQSFGPGFNPESLDDCLTEAVALGKPIVISETGCDARVQGHGDADWRVDNEVQKQYFEKIFPILMKYKDHLKAFFAWTLIRRHLEWDRGDFPLLGTVDIVKDGNRNIVGHHLNPASELLQRVFRDRVLAPAEIAI